MKKTLLLILLLMGMTLVPSLEAQQIKVISLNIHSNSTPEKDGNNAWSLRKKAVIKMIESESPDIIGVQEALLDQLVDIDRTFRNKYRRIGVSRDNGITRGEHAAIFYDKTKLELASSGKTRWLSPWPQRVSKGWDAKGPRIVTIAHFRVKKTGREFYYFNTHLEKQGTVAHRESIKTIAKLIKEIVPSNMPVIIGGDMNSPINIDEFLPLYDMNFESARDIAPRTDYRNTYNAFGDETGAMNDHFLVKNIYVLRFRTLIKKFGVPYISDHYPIMIMLDL